MSEIRYIPTICPYCTSGCGVYLVVKDGRIVGGEPRKGYPLNEGKTCISCRDVCPLCHCRRCKLERDSPEMVTKGVIPPPITFGMIRVLHVACQCVNCGQCEDVCSADIPLSKLVYSLNTFSSTLFNYDAGSDISAPLPLCAIPEEEKRLAGPNLA